MTVLELFGCTSFAFGPPLALFIFTIAQHPIRIIILIASSFFWLLSLLTSSLIYLTTDNKVCLIITSVLIQEIVRYLVYELFRTAQPGLIKISSPRNDAEMKTNDIIISYVSGLGFGIMSGCMSLSNLLSLISGPATAGFNDTPTYFPLMSSVFTLCFILLNTLWSVLLFSYMKRKEYFKISFIVLTHLFVSAITLLNAQYYITVPATYLTLIAVLCVTRFQLNTTFSHSLI